MANTSCSDSFPSINNLLVQVAAGQVDITTVVSTCEGICSMAWGPGNPDLSGIGLIRCYQIQAALTVLFGPLFCVFYHFFHDNFTDETNKNLEVLQDTFLDTVAQFSVPVAVAAVIRLHQDPPFYEIDFMYSLMTMQLLSLLSTTFTASIFDEPKSLIRANVICIYGISDIVSFMVFIEGRQTSTARWKAINELGGACQAYGTLLPGFEAIQNSRWLNKLTKVEWLLTYTGLVLGSLCIVAGLVWLAWKIVSGEGNIRRIGLMMMSVGLSIGMALELWRMMKTRAIMQHNTGTGFVDNEWGFAQVFAPFLWVPMCAQFIYCFLYPSQFVPCLRTAKTDVEKNC
ncbi:hypothetical protein FIBSPDRAFT_964219 [Athelia psychrophila]|uniref:Uncharacterized protein n=1 Tax=Athelia psychrophila TaxID=1759441 RepID=A0A165Y1K0_9AGAM|nr:hypothetical protein FIBSPDRAFT_964219 [Fibularhizoctonia sp. CBS 109695]